MAAIDNTRALSPRIAYNVISFCINAVADATTWNKARQTRKALMALTDRELDDIGLTRADVLRGAV